MPPSALFIARVFYSEITKNDELWIITVKILLIFRIQSLLLTVD